MFPDNPVKSKFLSSEDKLVAVEVGPSRYRKFNRAEPLAADSCKPARARDQGVQNEPSLRDDTGHQELVLADFDVFGVCARWRDYSVRPSDITGVWV